MDDLKITSKIIRENAFEQNKNTTGSVADPGKGPGGPLVFIFRQN